MSSNKLLHIDLLKIIETYSLLDNHNEFYSSSTQEKYELFQKLITNLFVLVNGSEKTSNKTKKNFNP